MWNAPPTQPCGPPLEFPALCTIVLKEGEPFDYLAGRGYCSVLGLFREAEPKVVSNRCVVKIGHLRQLSLQFLAESLAAFTLPLRDDEDRPGFPAWIKLTVFVRPYL